MSAKEETNRQLFALILVAMVTSSGTNTLNMLEENEDKMPQQIVSNSSGLLHDETNPSSSSILKNEPPSLTMTRLNVGKNSSSVADEIVTGALDNGLEFGRIFLNAQFLDDEFSCNVTTGGAVNLTSLTLINCYTKEECGAKLACLDRHDSSACETLKLKSGRPCSRNWPEEKTPGSSADCLVLNMDFYDIRQGVVECTTMAEVAGDHVDHFETTSRNPPRKRRMRTIDYFYVDVDFNHVLLSSKKPPGISIHLRSMSLGNLRRRRLLYTGEKLVVDCSVDKLPLSSIDDITVTVTLGDGKVVTLESERLRGWHDLKRGVYTDPIPIHHGIVAFTCCVNLPFGQVQTVCDSAVNFTVTDPEELTILNKDTKQSNFSLKFGQGHTLLCHARGDPVFISWRHNDKTIPVDDEDQNQPEKRFIARQTRHKLPSGNTITQYVLILPPTRDELDGIYTCLAESVVQNDTFHFHIDVEKPTMENKGPPGSGPIYIIRERQAKGQPQGKSGQSSSQQTLNCSVSSEPIAKITWRHNGLSRTAVDDATTATVVVNETVSMVTSTLHLTDGVQVATDDDRVIDRYTCIATVGHWTDTLDFLVGPFSHPIIIGKDDRNDTSQTFGVYDTNRNISCQSRGNPLPEIRWFHNGSHFNESFTTSIVQETHFPDEKNDFETETILSTIEWPILQEKFAGNYVCISENPMGADSLEFFIELEDKMADRFNSTATNDDDNDVENGGEILYMGLAIGLVSITCLAAATTFFRLKYSRTKKRLKNLSPAEINEFVHGNVMEVAGENFENSADGTQQAISLPFTTLIGDDELKIEHHKILGKGEFGVVYRGSLCWTSQGEGEGADAEEGRKDEEICVAVKTVKKSLGTDYLKEFLRELKIMNYIGSHPHIVQFLGANISKIEEGVVYGVVELSPFGNLKDYISKKMEICGLHTTQAIHNQLKFAFWSHQVANAMEFLECKKVIHSDLAARNILLFPDDLVKVTDFGLSRQIYRYHHHYSKKNRKVALPFAWMAIESLKRLEFSHLSDRWSFGVFVWEIWSFGHEPFAQASWDEDFIKKIEDGVIRLAKPYFADDILYDEMKKCWDILPQNRPSFRQLYNFFEQRRQDTCNHLQKMKQEQMVRELDDEKEKQIFEENAENATTSGYSSPPNFAYVTTIVDPSLGQTVQNLEASKISPDL